jgi:hypothetical protein
MAPSVAQASFFSRFSVANPLATIDVSAVKRRIERRDVRSQSRDPRGTACASLPPAKRAGSRLEAGVP